MFLAGHSSEFPRSLWRGYGGNSRLYGMGRAAPKLDGHTDEVCIISQSGYVPKFSGYSERCPNRKCYPIALSNGAHGHMAGTSFCEFSQSGELLTDVLPNVVLPNALSRIGSRAVHKWNSEEQQDRRILG